MKLEPQERPELVIYTQDQEEWSSYSKEIEEEVEEQATAWTWATFLVSSATFTILFIPQPFEYLLSWPCSTAATPVAEKETTTGLEGLFVFLINANLHLVVDVVGKGLEFAGWWKGK